MAEIPITITDGVIFAVLLISAVRAMLKGFVYEFMAIAAWVVAAVATLNFYETFKPIAQANIEPEWLANAAALGGLFLVILIPLSFISFRLSHLVQSSSIGPLDRTFGFLFGVGRGLIVLGLYYVVLSALLPPERQPPWITEARLLPLVQKTGDILLGLVPDWSEEDLAAQGKDPIYDETDRRALDDLIRQSNRKP